MINIKHHSIFIFISYINCLYISFLLTPLSFAIFFIMSFFSSPCFLYFIYNSSILNSSSEYSLFTIVGSIIIINSPFTFSVLSIISFILPLINDSCIFVISFARTIFTFPKYFNISLSVFISLWGASYKIIVFFSFINSSNFSFLFFLLIGKNP